MGEYLHNTENLTDQGTEQKSSLSEESRSFQDPVSELANQLYRYGHGDMYDYLDNLNLNTIGKSIVLISSNHYFFKKEDLRDIKMVVDIKNLARKRNIESYLSTINSNIPDGCYFTGCFETPTSKFSGNPDYHKYLFENNDDEEKNRNESNNLLGIIDKLINKLKISLSQNLTKADAEESFMQTGFNVIDMTEINGRIYFSAIKEPKYSNNYSLSRE